MSFHKSILRTSPTYYKKRNGWSQDSQVTHGNARFQDIYQETNVSKKVPGLGEDDFSGYHVTVSC